jgi:hypothetical protein
MTRERLYLADAPHCARILRRTKTECENPRAQRGKNSSKGILSRAIKNLNQWSLRGISYNQVNTYDDLNSRRVQLRYSCARITETIG